MIATIHGISRPLILTSSITIILFGSYINFFLNSYIYSGTCGASGKEAVYQYRRLKNLGFDPWEGKIPWRRAWQPTLVFLPQKSHGQKSLAGYSSWGHKELDMTETTYHHHEFISNITKRLIFMATCFLLLFHRCNFDLY